jgi:cardiolipin synthase
MIARRFRPILRPRAGRTLPPELRAANVGKIATELPEGVRDPGFEILLRRIDQAPILRGNRVEVFFSGEKAFASMSRDIEAAEREILMEAYIWKDDSTGQAFSSALARAATRGVAVRVLADAHGSLSTRSVFWQEMRRRGIEVRLFHPLLPYLWFYPLRNHRKILVVDRRVAYTGGMNISNEYGSSVSASADVWRDTHARIEGPTAWELAIVFSEGWMRAGGTPFELPPLPLVSENEARILVLDSRPGRGHRESASALAAILAAARRSVWITNAYFAPKRVAIELLGSAAERGVDVRLLLPGRSDVELVRHAGHGSFSDLLARGVRLFEYEPAVLHAKTLVADDYVSVVGSTNMDFRSFHLNAECNLVILDARTARTLAMAFENDLEDAAEIREGPWSRRRLPHRAADWLARRLSPLL